MASWRDMQLLRTPHAGAVRCNDQFCGRNVSVKHRVRVEKSYSLLAKVITADDDAAGPAASGVRRRDAPPWPFRNLRS
jgi:hypothetical protein